MREGIVGFTAGAFDLCHAGHVLMFEDAKSVCDYLIVALQTDPTVDRPFKNKPVQSIDERRIQLEAIKYIDKIVFYTTEKELDKLVLDINPGVIVKGSDRKPLDKLEVRPYNTWKSYYHKRTHRYSSSSLRQLVYDAERLKNE